MKVRNVLVAFDQFVNTLLGGYVDETFSARCWRLRQFQPYKTLRQLIDWLFWFDADHCRSSFISEQQRKDLPKDY